MNRVQTVFQTLSEGIRDNMGLSTPHTQAQDGYFVED